MPRGRGAEHYWLPTRAEQGVPYEAQTRAAGHVAAAEVSLVPVAAGLAPAGRGSAPKILDAVERRKAARQAALAASACGTAAPTRRGPELRQPHGHVQGPARGRGLGGEDDPAARFDDSSTWTSTPSRSSGRRGSSASGGIAAGRGDQEGAAESAEKKHRAVSRILDLDELASEKYKLAAEQAVAPLRRQEEGHAPRLRTDKEGEVQRYADSSFESRPSRRRRRATTLFLCARKFRFLYNKILIFECFVPLSYSPKMTTTTTTSVTAILRPGCTTTNRYCCHPPSENRNDENETLL